MHSSAPAEPHRSALRCVRMGFEDVSRMHNLLGKRAFLVGKPPTGHLNTGGSGGNLQVNLPLRDEPRHARHSTLGPTPAPSFTTCFDVGPPRGSLELLPPTPRRLLPDVYAASTNACSGGRVYLLERLADQAPHALADRQSACFQPRRSHKPRARSVLCGASLARVGTGSKIRGECSHRAQESHRL